MENVSSTGFERLTNVKDVLDMISNLSIEPMDREPLSVWDALGKVSGVSVRSNIAVPSFNRAAMDGYAVKARETSGSSLSDPTFLRLAQELHAGTQPEQPLEEGEAMQINTGAKLPRGADAVVRVENAEKEGNYIKIYDSVYPGKDVSEKGEDVAKGELVVQQGELLTPFHLSLLTAVKQFTIQVREQPRVGFFACGDELLDPKTLIDDSPSVLSQGKLIESNRIMLEGLINHAGAVPRDLGIVKDNISAIQEIITKEVQRTDLLLSIGGTSTGTKDLIPHAIANLNTSEMLVHGINAMPGKPFLLSTVTSEPVLSLPGYPVSTAVDFLLFVKPLIKRLLAQEEMEYPCSISATLTRKVASKPGRIHFVRVKLKRENGKIFAEPVRIKGAGVLKSLVKADGFLIVPTDKEGFEKDAHVNIVRFKDVSGGSVLSAIK